MLHLQRTASEDVRVHCATDRTIYKVLTRQPLNELVGLQKVYDISLLRQKRSFASMLKLARKLPPYLFPRACSE